MNEMISIKKRLNKRGQSEAWPSYTVIWFIFFGILLGFTAVYLVFVLTSFGSKKLIIPEGFEKSLELERFHSGSCFLLSNEEGIKPGILDFSKFTPDRLNYCYKPKGKFAYRIELMGESLNAGPIATSNWLENSIVMGKESYDVNVLKDDKIIKGVMEIEIQKVG